MEGFYTVYDNTTDCAVAQGTWAEVEDYYECSGRYTVVSVLNGQIIE
jgi:hypothetical protein